MIKGDIHFYKSKLMDLDKASVVRFIRIYPVRRVSSIYNFINHIQKEQNADTLCSLGTFLLFSGCHLLPFL